MGNGRGRRAFAALAASGVIVAIAASASASSAKVYGIKDCTTPKVRPARIVLTCADAGLWIDSTHYRDWGGKSAHGSGTLHAKTCKPSCAAGKVKDYPVKFRLYRIHRGMCGNRRVRLYRRIHLRPTSSKRPPGFQQFRDTKLYCT